MSGAGKSFWTRKLAAAGFRAIGIDDRIERELASELAAGGYRGIAGVAAWMGWPDQPTYRDRERKYLESEIRCMHAALDEIEESAGEGIVLDTTGSVVYTGEELCRRLRSLTTVVHLAASPEEEKVLVARYLSDPKPVLWGDCFSQQAGESAPAAIARCYPLLIAQRRHLYERYAHCTVFTGSFRQDPLDARGFLELIEGRARHAQ